VEAILGAVYKKGLKLYTTLWKAGDTTEEPEANLVNASEMVRAFNEARTETDRADKARVVEIRALRKAEALAAESEAKAAATAAALATAMSNAQSATEDSEASPTDVVMQRGGRMVLRCHRHKTATVWRAFDLLHENPPCILETSPGVKCGCCPSSSGGTSNFWQHLYCHHRTIWLEYKHEDNQLTPVGQTELAEVNAAIAARNAAFKKSAKKPPLAPKARVHVDRLVAEWVVDQDQFANAGSKPGIAKVFSALTDGAYDGVCEKTVNGHVAKLAVEGKAKTTALHDIVLNRNRLKAVISADLWSKNGVALLGVLSHAIVEIKFEGQDLWVMVEMLAGAIPCKKDRHTGEFVEVATFAELAKTGIEKPIENIFKAKTDRGSNMIKGYEQLDHDPCSDHLIDTSVGVYYAHESVAPSLKKGRAIVGSFNSSTIGKADLAECQTAVGVPTKQLTQDVVTRWASTHAMTNSLRENQDALMLYDVKKADVASDTYKANKATLEEWHINNQTCAVLGGLAAASNVLEGKKYPTSNLILPYVYMCIAGLHADAVTVQMWDGGAIQPKDLHPSVKAARAALHESLMGFWVADIPTHRLNFLLICTLLDPRLIDLRLPLITAQTRTQARDAFLAEYALNWAPLKSKENEVEKGPSEEAPPKEDQGDGGSCGSFRQVGMGSFSEFMGAMEAHGMIPDAVVEDKDEDKAEVGEAEAYLEMQKAPQTVDVLQWWASHKSVYPNLARMAQQFLAVPATSASCERVFSLAGRIFGDLTQNQNDCTLEERMWAKINRNQVLE